MAFDPAALLTGPRGRRLLLECARGMAAEQDSETAEELLWALQHLEHALDPSGGRTVTFGAAGGPPTQPPSYSVEEFARLLAELPLVPVSARELAFSLRDAVDSARYWQAPDGGDVLGALPPVTDGLARIAEHICRSPFVASFARTPDTSDQWSILPAD